MDVVDTVIESPEDLHLKETFQRAGALGAQHANTISKTSPHQAAKTERAKNVRQPESSNDLTTELLLNNYKSMTDIVEANATNLKGLTAMDVVDTVIESPEDLPVKEMFQRAGALGAQHANTISKTSPHQAAKIERVRNTIELLLNNNNSMSDIVEANATNLKGLTNMDVMDTVIESPEDLLLKETFQCAGALGAQHANTISKTSPHQAAKIERARNVRQPESSNDLTTKLLLNNNNSISDIVEENATNLKGLTAMDVVDTVIESPEDLPLKETFQRARALGAQHANTISKTFPHQAAKTERAQNIRQPESSNDLTTELLLNNNNSMTDIVEANATNLKDLTALDVVDTVIESPEDLPLKETFQRAGALGAQHANTMSKTSPHQAAKTERAKNTTELLLNNNNSMTDIVEANATNLKDLTALDVVDTVIESPEYLPLKETFQRAGALGAQHANTISKTSPLQAAKIGRAKNVTQPESSNDLMTELLLNNNNSMSDIVEENATNLKGTTMDVVDAVIESPEDLSLKETFQRVGALGAQHASTISKTFPLRAAKTERAKNVRQPESSNDWRKYLKFQEDSDSPHVARNELLVVAALIATVTFQAGVDPPDGILKGNSHLETNAITFLFVFANTMGLTAALSIITYLTIGFPFQRELLISMVSMVFAYGFAIASVTKGGIPYTLLVAAFIVTFFQRRVIIWVRKIWKGGDKLQVTSNDDGGSGTNC